MKFHITKNWSRIFGQTDAGFHTRGGTKAVAASTLDVGALMIAINSVEHGNFRTVVESTEGLQLVAEDARRDTAAVLSAMANIGDADALIIGYGSTDDVRITTRPIEEGAEESLDAVNLAYQRELLAGRA